MTRELTCGRLVASSLNYHLVIHKVLFPNDALVFLLARVIGMLGLIDRYEAIGIHNSTRNIIGGTDTSRNPRYEKGKIDSSFNHSCRYKQKSQKSGNMIEKTKKEMGFQHRYASEGSRNKQVFHERL
ncbi:hypothetical protein L2E82_15157 [Cichorium intybus]|uniref:Uncharacterized protein n=1 Tax=Cichorium intybus TaxID=13427 RepID=A0ACB9F371_CICIN|nr:hypothetical protein L2E82_15157 [Cichorium intybus]